MLLPWLSRSNLSLSGGRYEDTTGNQKLEIMRSWIKEIEEADKKGEEEIVLYKQWGFRIWENGAFPKALYHHNVVNKIMNIKIELDT